MPTLDVFSRQGCHLCEVLIEQLIQLVHDRADVVVHDIDSRDEWRRAYDRRVPVVEFCGTPVCEVTLDDEAVLAALAAKA